MKLATNAFFFQEGHSKAFENLEYGLFRINNKGEPLLANMVNGGFEIIKSVNTDNVAVSESLESMGRQGSGM